MQKKMLGQRATGSLLASLSKTGPSESAYKKKSKLQQNREFNFVFGQWFNNIDFMHCIEIQRN
jgi:hypothetical protein